MLFAQELWLSYHNVSRIKLSQDWKTNLTFRKKVVPYGNDSSKIRIHSGFIYAYKSPSVRDVIHSVISNDIYNIKLTGHSQGAALALSLIHI